jgi:hypothetical protein
MTILLRELAEAAVNGTTKLSSRPKRSEVEGPAVSFSAPNLNPSGDQLFGLRGKERIHRLEHRRAALSLINTLA